MALEVGGSSPLGHPFAMSRDCEDPPRSSVMLLGCGSVIVSVTHFAMTGFVPFL